jgi:hypothetical protein
MSLISPATPGITSAMSAGPPGRSGRTQGRTGEAWSESGKARGRADEELETQKKGRATRHAPLGGSYLLLGGDVEGVAGVGAGPGVPVPGAGVGVVGGTTVALGRVRSGWTPNSTSLSLPLP